METGSLFKTDSAKVADFYIDNFWGKVGTPRRDALEAFLVTTKGMDHESPEFVELQAKFHSANFEALQIKPVPPMERVIREGRAISPESNV
jgi:hypothetical protein